MPNKNIRPLAGHPLLAYAIAFCTMIVTDLLLIPRFGINGAAIGSSIS